MMCREICQILEEDGLVGEGITPNSDQATVAFRKMVHQLKRLGDQVMEFHEALEIFDSVVEHLQADPADPENINIRLELKTQVRHAAKSAPPTQPRSSRAHPDAAGFMHRRCSLNCVRRLGHPTGSAASACWTSSSPHQGRPRSNASYAWQMR
jgi:hypothetical protein